MPVPAAGYPYPEYNDPTPGWKARFDRRLEAEGRKGPVRIARKAYQKRTACNDEEAWRWACDEYPPINAEKKRLESIVGEEKAAEIIDSRADDKKVRKGRMTEAERMQKRIEVRDSRRREKQKPDDPNWNQEGVESYVDARTIDKMVGKKNVPIDEAIQWAMENMHTKGGISVEDAPSQSAYSLWMYAVTSPHEFTKTFIHFAKKQNDNEDQRWLKDDEKLADLMGRNLTEIRARATGSGV